jgi:hypothetical protein
LQASRFAIFSGNSEIIVPVVGATEFSRKVGRYQSVAQRKPVAVTCHSHAETVLISAEEYRRLTRCRRRVFDRAFA